MKNLKLWKIASYVVAAVGLVIGFVTDKLQGEQTKKEVVQEVTQNLLDKLKEAK